MRIDHGQISGHRFMFSIICFLQSSALLAAFLTSIVQHESWMVILAGTLVCLLYVAIYRALMVSFPDMNLIEMLETVFGKVVGKAVGVLYVLFFLTLSSLNLQDLGNLAKLTLMNEMPIAVIMLMCILVSTVAVRHGVKSVTWYSAFFSSIAFIILILTVLLVTNLIDLKNFLPMFQQPVKKYIQSVHVISSIPFGELVVFLMLTPNVNMTRKEATKYLFLGFLLGAATIFVAVARDISVLGNTIKLFASPSLVTLRMVHFGETLGRMEILFSVALIMLLFFKIMVLHYVSVMTIAQILKIKDFRHLALVCGAYLLVYGLTLFPSSIEHSLSGQQTTPVGWTLFELIIPLILLIVAKLRKLPEKRSCL